MSIPINNPEQYTVAPSSGFTPDRLGVRSVVIDIGRDDNKYRTRFTPCPATETSWGAIDAPEVSTADLLAELMAAVDSPEKQAALLAVQNISDGLVTVASFLLSLRSE